MPSMTAAVLADDGDGLVELVSRSGRSSSSRPWLIRSIRRRIRVISSLGWHRVGACPLVEFGGGEQAFAGAQQVVEVGVQVGQVGDVGAEVVAAGAAEPERAGAAAGLHVGRFGADAERDGDLTDSPAGVFGVQQRSGLPPDAVTVPVELHRGDAVDGFAAAVFADPVVAAGGSSLPVSISSRSTSTGTPASAWRWA